MHIAPDTLPSCADESQDQYRSAATLGGLGDSHPHRLAAPTTASAGAAATTRDLSEINPGNYFFLEAETPELEEIQVSVADGSISSCHFSKESWQG